MGFLTLICSWDDYFPTNIHVSETYKDKEFTEENETLKPNNANTYITDCYFHSLKNSNAGAAIYYSKKESYLLIEKCSFVNCSTTKQTAAIRVTGGNTVMSFLCGYNCYSQNNDGFSSVSLDTTIHTNFFLDSSISHCISQGHYIMVLQYGFTQVKSSNISQNSAIYYSTFLLRSTKASNEKRVIGGLTGFCSISNNTAENQYCFSLKYYNDPIIHLVKNSNIINNIGNDIINIEAETEIIQTCIINNGKPLFQIQGSTSSITLINCTTDKVNEQVSGSFEEIETSYPFIVALTFFETGICRNLFVQFTPTVKCATKPVKNYFIHKMILSFIFILSSSFE